MSEVNMNKLFKKLSPLLIFSFLIVCILNIEGVIYGVRNALYMCAFSIIPSLFLFLVLADIAVTLILDSKANIPPKIIIFVLGAVCGFPVGAVVCDRLHESGVLSEKSALKLIPFCNNASPSFVIGALGVSMLGSQKLGIIIYLSSLISSLLFLIPIKTEIKKSNSISASTASKVFFSSIENAVSSILKICGLICVFSALISVARNCFEERVVALLSIFAEISNGCSNALQYFGISKVSVFLLAFACGFSGVCVHLQIISALKHIRLPFLNLFFSKLMQGITSGIIALIGYDLLLYY